jgi:hypothetical protein
MPFFRLDDRGTFHPKVMAAGNEAYGAWCRAGQWCSQWGTDGRIPHDVAHSIGPARVWQRLIAAGLCNPPVPGATHYEMHDFLDWNPSAEEVAAHRREVAAKRQEAGRVGGLRSAAARRARSVPPPAAEANEANAKQTPEQTASKPEASEAASAKQTGQQDAQQTPEQTGQQDAQQTPEQTGQQDAQQTPEQTGQQKRTPDPDPDPDLTPPSPLGTSPPLAGGGEQTAPPKASKPARARKPASSCPPVDASPGDVAAWAERWRIDAQHVEFPAFLDHHRARAATFAEWGAAWSTWLRRAKQFAGERRARVPVQGCDPDSPYLRALEGDEDAMRALAPPEHRAPVRAEPEASSGSQMRLRAAPDHGANGAQPHGFTAAFGDHRR